MSIALDTHRCQGLVTPKKHRTTDNVYYVKLFYHGFLFAITMFYHFLFFHVGRTSSDLITAHFPITANASRYPIRRASFILLATTTVCHV